MCDNPNLPCAKYPVSTDYKCIGCGTGQQVPRCDMKPGVCYKNGVPYVPNCDYIVAPYSMPYEALNDRQCQPPYQAICNPNHNNCKCHKRATLWNKNDRYEAFR